MLQPQRSKLLGDLYYDNTPRPFVPPPIEERKAFFKQKEDDYLFAKDSKNELENILKTMPYLESNTDSKSVYDDMIRKSNNVLSKINADNYEDNVLNVKQLAHDIYNKFGGYELVTEAQQMSDLDAQIDEAIKDPERANWTKQQNRLNHKGIRFNEDGTITRPKVSGRPIIKDVNVQEKLLKLMDDWKADGYVVTDPTTGKLIVNREIPGYLGFKKGEVVTEDELAQAGMAYMEADLETKQYLDEYAQFKASQIPPTAENLNRILSPTVKEAVFGNSNISDGEIQAKIDNGEINPSDFINQYIKQTEKVKALEAPVAKYGYRKEELTTLEDKLLMEALKTSASNNAAKTQEESNVAISVEPFKVKPNYNTIDINNINTQKKQLSDERLKVQAEIASYNLQLNEGKGISPQQLDLMNKQVTELDNKIAAFEEQERIINKQFEDLAKKSNVGLTETYNKYYNESVNETIKTNKEILNNDRDSLIDVTSLYNKENNTLFNKKLPDGTGKMRSSYDNDIIIKDGKYYLRPSEIGYDKDLLDILEDYAFNSSGNINNTIVKSSASFYDTPEEEEFKSMAVQAYANNESSTNFGVPKSFYKDYKNKLLFSGALLNAVDKVKKQHGSIDEIGGLNGTQDMNYFMVEGETTKNTSKQYVSMRSILNQSFKKTPQQYEVDGRSIADILVNDYGLPDISDKYIDWDKTSAEYLIQRDRVNGTQYGLDIKLTKEGKEKLDSLWFTNATMDKNANSIKLIANNPTKNKPEEDAKIRDLMFSLYAEVADTSTYYKESLAKDMGELYFNTKPEGEKLDNLNLYVLPNGEEAKLKINEGTSNEEQLNIKSIARSTRQSNIRNVDYEVSRFRNNTRQIFATDNKGNTGWISDTEVGVDKNYNSVYFKTPSDIKQVLGATLLASDYKKYKTADAVNPYADYLESLKTNGYTQTSNASVQRTDYNSYLNNLKNIYNNNSYNINITNTTGNKVTIESKVPAEDLYDLRTKHKSKVSNFVSYPYVHKDISTYVDKILEENNLIVSGGFRGEATHFGLKESAQNSTHKYAHGIDFRADKEGEDFYTRVSTNPDLLKQYGIAKIYRHVVDGVPHIHTEFYNTQL
jgi:hypothetical protein